MRVCFVSRRFFPAISGMSVYALNFLRELVAQGHEPVMVSQYRGDAAGTRIYGGGPPPAVPGVRIVGLEAVGEQSGGDFERDIDAMVEAIEREHARAPFDVLHAQYAYPNGWAALQAGARLGLPVVVSIQGGDGHWVGECCATHAEAMRRVLDGADALLIGGASFVDEVAHRLGTPRERFTIVPGAVDTQRFAPAPGRVPGALHAPPRLLYHGRVDRRKGVLDFVDALAQLAARGVAFEATISGIGPDLDAARERTARWQLGAPGLRFSGYADYAQVPALYAASDLFVSPTYAEGFSNTILEAMACGLPVVSCRSVGVVDCLRDGENGLLVEAGDVAAQAGAIERLLSDAPLRRRLADTALAECRATYAWPTVTRAIVATYARLARAPRAPRALDAALPAAPCRFRAEPHLL